MGSTIDLACEYLKFEFFSTEIGQRIEWHDRQHKSAALMLDTITVSDLFEMVKCADTEYQSERLMMVIFSLCNLDRAYSKKTNTVRSQEFVDALFDLMKTGDTVQKSISIRCLHRIYRDIKNLTLSEDQSETLLALVQSPASFNQSRYALSLVDKLSRTKKIKSTDSMKLLLDSLCLDDEVPDNKLTNLLVLATVIEHENLSKQKQSGPAALANVMSYEKQQQYFYGKLSLSASADYFMPESIFQTRHGLGLFDVIFGHEGMHTHEMWSVSISNAHERFIKADGAKTLVGLLDSPNEKIRLTASYVLANLVRETGCNYKIKVYLRDNGYIPNFLKLLSQDTSKNLTIEILMALKGLTLNHSWEMWYEFSNSHRTQLIQSNLPLILKLLSSAHLNTDANMFKSYQVVVKNILPYPIQFFGKTNYIERVRKLIVELYETPESTTKLSDFNLSGKCINKSNLGPEWILLLHELNLQLGLHKGQSQGLHGELADALSQHRSAQSSTQARETVNLSIWQSGSDQRVQKDMVPKAPSKSQELSQQ